MKGDQLEITDALMFDWVMKDPEICRGMLECILGFEIERLEYVNAEQQVLAALGAAGVRLDAFARTQNKAFNIEMQAAAEPYLGRRLRFYQGAMDVASLERGRRYSDLGESFVIFICKEDPFGLGIPAYTLRPTCEEEPSVNPCARMTWLVLNASAWEKDTDPARSALLSYVSNGEVANVPYVRRLAQAVREGNADEELRRQAMGFMTAEHNWAVREQYAMEQGLEQGLEQGRAEGEAIGAERAEERYSRLVDCLLEQKRYEDLERCAKDPAFRAELFKELL